MRLWKADNPLSLIYPVFFPEQQFSKTHHFVWPVTVWTLVILKMSSLCLKGFGLADWNKAVKNNPSALSVCHMPVWSPGCHYPGVPQKTLTSCSTFTSENCQSQKDEWEGYSAFHRSRTCSKWGTVTWMVTVCYRWSRKLHRAHQWTICKINLWTESGLLRHSFYMQHATYTECCPSDTVN